MADTSPTPQSPSPEPGRPADAAAQGIQPATSPLHTSPTIQQPNPPAPTMQEWIVYRLFQVGALAVLWVVCNAALCYFFRFRNLDASILAVVLSVVGSFFLRPLLPFQSPADKYKTAPPPPKPSQQPNESVREIDPVREILETVVFVVVLVLMLKTFVAEAFVIPTGSMAETLYGYQKLITCPSCRYSFPLNASDEVDPESGRGGRVSDCICPNCRLGIHLKEPVENGRKVVATDLRANEVIDGDTCWCGDQPIEGWRSGDRVLVAKFTYDLPGREPERLDVVVFKFPGDEQPRRGGEKGFPFDSGPIKNHAPMNYIKRLTGRPGEIIAIHRGKLYVLSPEKVKAAGLNFDEYEKAKGDPEKLANLWRPRFMHRDDKAAVDLFKEGKFDIVRKPAAQVRAMMRLVYDNDFQATDQAGAEAKRWRPAFENGWKEHDKTAFEHDGSGEGWDWLSYRHLTPERADRRLDEIGKPSLITDFMGYNTGRPHQLPGDNWASDLMVECIVDVKKASGTLALELSRGNDRFQAAFAFASGECVLSRITGPKDKEKTVELKRAVENVKGTGLFLLRFANVDDRLLVWAGERPLFGKVDGVEGVPYEATGNVVPTEYNDLERPVSIGTKGAAVTVSRLRVYRDTYYTAAARGDPSAADVQFDPKDPSTFGGWKDAPVSTFYVQPDHYLCMGDNSPASSDSRTWGLVPRRLLLGRALLVYYPFQRAGQIR